LSDAPPYEALSYVWGPFNSPDDPDLIQLNDCGFEVTTNLWRALYALRHETKDRVLWIDAICINQGDLEERSSQVQLMRDVYRKARSVVVWLGEEGTWTTELFKYLKKTRSTRVRAVFSYYTL